MIRDAQNEAIAQARRAEHQLMLTNAERTNAVAAYQKLEAQNTAGPRVRGPRGRRSGS